MFSNFLYFIVVLLIYSFYQPPDKIEFGQFETLLLFSALTLVFTMITYAQFRILETRVARYSNFRFDHKYDTLVTQQTILSIILFSLGVYWLNLPMIVRDIPFIKEAPTLEALLFLSLFMLFLVIIWSCAHRSHDLLQRTDTPLKEFLVSHISFFVPVLIPFILLSGIHDIIFILPFDFPKLILSTQAGEAGYFLLFLFIMAIFGPVLIQKSWGCTPLTNGIERARIEAFCRKADMEFTDILSWPLFGGRMITAGVMGFVRKFRYILVTPALLHFLDFRELDAVIAHEIGHVKKKHLIFYFFFIATFLLTIVNLQFLTSQIILAAVLNISWLSFLMEGRKGNWFVTISSFEVFLFIILCVICFRYIFGYFMRNFEREADIHIFQYNDSAEALISSLKKIVAVSGQSPEKPNWHHFSIKERIDYLTKCNADKNWITRHHKKVRISIIVYLIAIIAINGAGYMLKTGETGEKFNIHLIEAMLTSQRVLESDNPEFLSFAGDYFYLIKKDYLNAINAYERSLAFDPENPDVLNNLSWLFATCEDKACRNPQKALELAEKAASLKKAAYILDTLAESYFVNGKYQEAFKTEEAAFKLIGPKEDRPHYERQLKKFEDAMKGLEVGG